MLGGCSRSGWEQTSQKVSPDKQYMAIAEYKGAPASNSDHRRVRLVALNGTAPPSGETVLSSANADRAVLNWDGNDILIVEICGATKYEVKARHFREPTFKANGDENAIRVEAVALGGVDKFEPVSGGGDVNHAEEAFGELIISSGDGAVDFQTAEEAFDVIAFLVERPVMFDLDAAVRTAWDDGLDVAARKVGADGVGVIPLVGQ